MDNQYNPQQPDVQTAAPGAPEQPAYSQPEYQQPVYQQPAYSQPEYQQPAYQQPAYQQPAYQGGYAPPPPPVPNNGLMIASLIVGILALLLFLPGILIPVVGGVIMAILAVAAIIFWVFVFSYAVSNTATIYTYAYAAKLFF